MQYGGQLLLPRVRHGNAACVVQPYLEHVLAGRTVAHVNPASRMLEQFPVLADQNRRALVPTYALVHPSIEVSEANMVRPCTVELEGRVDWK